MINEGASLIIGHHPHNLQSRETFKDKKIFYSLGNFYFSSKRDNFKKRKFKYKIENMCDYGLGVVYNIDKNLVEKEIILYYNIKTKNTEIIEDSELVKILLSDITNIDYKDKKYEQLVKNNSININPILTCNKFFNFVKILKLKIHYIRGRIIQKILKIKIINMLYCKIRRR